MATLGIVGGMGPLASAEFLHTIYTRARHQVEQEMPVCVMLSDPSIPDRTTAILTREKEEVTRCLTRSIETLQAMGADRVVIACVTAHHFLPALPASSRDSVISLLDLMMEGVLESRERHMVLCTVGTRRTGILMEHPLWPEAAPYLELPTAEEQALIHDLLYRIKVDSGGEGSLAALDAYLREYPARRFLAACTEVHLLHRYLASRGMHSTYSILDPLMMLAERLDAYMAPATLLTEMIP